MEYIKIENNNYKREDIEKVSNVINAGGVIVIPTDTVYGISVDSMNEDAVKKIYEIKRRKFSQPFSILVSNIEMMREVAKEISEKEERIINRFFPGAMTIILNKSKKIPDIVTSGLDTIGVRIPNNKFILDLVDYLR